MKTAQELASEFGTSPAEQKRQALSMRRLAGGVNAAADRKDSSGLTDKEAKTLREAAAILSALASNHMKAEKLKEREYAKRDEVERAVRRAMGENFVALSSIPDQVALISAVRSYILRDGEVKNLKDLKFYFDDCIDSLSYTLTTKSLTASPQQVVDDAWAKFEAAKPDLLKKQTTVIGHLSITAELGLNPKER